MMKLQITRYKKMNYIITENGGKAKDITGQRYDKEIG